MSRALDVLSETIEYYGEDPAGRRGVKRETFQHTDECGQVHTKNSASCMYVVTNGDRKFCAVGRCLIEDLWDWASDVAGSVEDLISEYWTGYEGNEEACVSSHEHLPLNPQVEHTASLGKGLTKPSK